MSDDFLSLAFRATDPLTLATVATVGLILGAMFLAELVRAGREAMALWMMVVLGIAFFTFCMTSRALQGVVTWPGWIGVAVLWLVFVGAAWVGLRLRARVRRSAWQRS